MVHGSPDEPGGCGIPQARSSVSAPGRDLATVGVERHGRTWCPCFIGVPTGRPVTSSHSCAVLSALPVLLTSRILYAVHDFLTRSPARTSGRPEALLRLRGLCDLCGGPSLVAALPRCE